MQPSEAVARGPSRRAETVVVCVLTAIIAGLNLVAPMHLYDGGISASAATFTTHGLLPYRDYWLLYGPLSGWLLALPVALLGPTTALLKLAGLAVLVAQAAAGYALISRRAVGPPAVVVAVGATVVLPPFVGLEMSAWPLAMALAFGGLAVAQTGRAGWAGLLIGLAFASRLDVGAYALIAALLWPNRLRLFAGFASVAVPVAAVAIATTPLDRLYEQLIWYPLVGPRQFRGLAPPSVTGDIGEALIALSLLILPRAVILAAVVELVRKRSPRGLAVMTVFAVLCQLQTLGRADDYHLAQGAAPALLLLGYLLEPGARWRRAAVRTAGAACLGIGLLGLVFVIGDADASDAQVREAAAVVRASTSPDDPIYVGVTDHRYTVANSMIVYYLADRRPGTRTTMFNPGVTNTDDRQREMAQELDASSTNVLYLDTRYLPLGRESNASSQPGSMVLNEYIDAQFEEACRIGPIVLMERRGRDILACP